VAELLGPIVRLQVQAEPLKWTGIYDPGPLMLVERATISGDGMLGWVEPGWVVDAHHAAHPASRGAGRRALSIGLTGHYDAMSERFDGVVLGIGGENIIVEGPPLRMPVIAGGFTVRRRNGGEIVLREPLVAAPCLEFTSYLLGSDGVLPRDQVVDELAFLGAGTRGHIVAFDGAAPALVEVGDEVWLNERPPAQGGAIG
jgi:hypothetical protein